MSELQRFRSETSMFNNCVLKFYYSFAVVYCTVDKTIYTVKMEIPTPFIITGFTAV